MSERMRTTISVPEEVLEVFKRMADAANMSVSRCMGDWLTDTVDAAEMVTIKMEEAKVAPMRVIREMRSLVAGMAVSVDEAEQEARARRSAGRPGTRAGGAVPLPPSSNTGGKSPTANAKKTTSRVAK